MLAIIAHAGVVYGSEFGDITPFIAQIDGLNTYEILYCFKC